VSREFRELDRAILHLEALLRKVRSYAKRLRTHARKLRREVEGKGFWIDYAYVRGYGPYYRLRWVENGEVKCKYLGRNPKIPESLEKGRKVEKLMAKLADLDNEAEKLTKKVEKAAQILEETFK